MFQHVIMIHNNMKTAETRMFQKKKKRFNQPAAPNISENIHSYSGCSCFGGHGGLCARQQVKKWWHCMDTPFQTDSHRNFWLWFPPSDGWNEKDSYTYFKAQGSTKGLRNKEVRTFELNKGPSPTFHIRCAV